MHNYLTTAFYGLNNHPEFVKGVQHALNQIAGQNGIYTGDNLFTYHRNLSFLEDEKLMTAFRKHAETQVEQSILWRIATVTWGARNGMRLEGDFVEIACYKGTTARVVCDYVDFASHTDRHYYLYDLFDHDPNMPHHAMPEHSRELYAKVKQRFADTPNVTVTQGKVPDVLADVAPEKIAFMHLDLNNADAEVGALEVLFDRMVPGAVLVLDDYGWLGYREQKLAEDPWFEKRGYRVLELPTGQGLLIK
ncbi:MAG TPA: class I SAM-dependent methyltransferase [Burkholderiaceae bacterium]|nr:class I SAM-dependent methyltransferase [Burkholderiaceae bacterium]